MSNIPSALLGRVTLRYADHPDDDLRELLQLLVAGDRRLWAAETWFHHWQGASMSTSDKGAAAKAQERLDIPLSRRQLLRTALQYRELEINDTRVTDRINDLCPDADEEPILKGRPYVTEHPETQDQPGEEQAGEESSQGREAENPKRNERRRAERRGAD